MSASAAGLRHWWAALSVRARAAGVAAVVVLVLVGAAFVAAGVRGGSPDSTAGSPAPSVSASASASSSVPAPVAPPPTASTPPAYADFHLSIPELGVESDLMQLGLNADRTVEVPPLSKDAPAGWYKFSPTPGDVGPSVILGHIDSLQFGPGVFYRLKALSPGDEVTVDRADKRTAVFRVDSVQQFAKDAFPTQLIYGDTPDAQLRLITCGGTFDAAAGSYEDNIVAFATLVSLTP